MCPDDLKIWLNHFEYHAGHPRSIPDGLEDVLEPEERRLIAGSIATFQLGEQSDGTTLLHAAQRFCARQQLGALVRIVELFVREEQRHAALLRAFMRTTAFRSSAGTGRIRCSGACGASQASNSTCACSSPRSSSATSTTARSRGLPAANV